MTKRAVAVDEYIRQSINTNPVTAAGKKFEANEDGIALAFAEQYENRLLFDHNRGCWFVWTGDHWQVEETDLAFDYARTLVRKHNKELNDKSLTRVRFAGEVERAARADRRLVARHEEWDADPNLLGVPGGLIDLSTGELLPPDPRMMMTRQAASALIATRSRHGTDNTFGSGYVGCTFRCGPVRSWRNTRVSF